MRVGDEEVRPIVADSRCSCGTSCESIHGRECILARQVAHECCIERQAIGKCTRHPIVQLCDETSASESRPQTQALVCGSQYGQCVGAALWCASQDCVKSVTAASCDV